MAAPMDLDVGYATVVSAPTGMNCTAICGAFLSKNECTKKDPDCGCEWVEADVMRSARGACMSRHDPFADRMAKLWLMGMDKPSQEQIDAAMREARSLTQFWNIIGDSPTPEDLIRAYTQQRRYENPAKPTSFQGETWDTLDAARAAFMAKLDAVGNPARWLDDNAYILHTKEPNPDWDGVDAANQFIRGEKTVKPGDIIWSGGDMGLIDISHMEIYLGLWPRSFPDDWNETETKLVPWSAGLGITAGNDPVPVLDKEGHEIMDERTKRPLMKTPISGSVSAGPITEQFNGHGDDPTYGVFDAYSAEERLPAMTTVKMAVACLGLWAYKMAPKPGDGSIGTLFSSVAVWMRPEKLQRAARNCQSFVTFAQTGHWFSPGVEVVRRRITMQLAGYAGHWMKKTLLRAVGAGNGPLDAPIPGAGMPFDVRHGLQEMKPDSPLNIASVAKEMIGSRVKYKLPKADPMEHNGCTIEKQSLDCYNRALNAMLEKLRAYKRDIDRQTEIGQLFNPQRKANMKSPKAKSKYQKEEAQANTELESIGNRSGRYIASLPPGRTVNDDIAAVDAALRNPRNAILPPHLMVLPLEESVKVKCGDTEICRKINELRLLLTRQTGQYAKDPTTGMPLSPQNVSDIMSEPPAITSPIVVKLVDEAARQPQRARRMANPY